MQMVLRTKRFVFQNIRCLTVSRGSLNIFHPTRAAVRVSDCRLVAVTTFSASRSETKLESPVFARFVTDHRGQRETTTSVRKTLHCGTIISPFLKGILLDESLPTIRLVGNPISITRWCKPFVDLPVYGIETVLQTLFAQLFQSKNCRRDKYVRINNTAIQSGCSQLCLYFINGKL